MRRLLRVLFLSAAGVLGLAGTAHAVVPTVVTFGFDDGTVDQLTAAQALQAHGMHGTFFVNSNRLGQSGFLTYDNLTTLQSQGNEIGGHTLDHANLEGLAPDQQQHQVCDDRTALTSHGLNVPSFAYPNGGDGPNSDAIHALVQGCGYTSARTTRGLEPNTSTTATPNCDLCSEPLPIGSTWFFRTRAFQLRGTGGQPDPTADTDLTNAIKAARDDNANRASTSSAYTGGWLQFVLHDVCAAPGCTPDEYTISPTQLNTVLDFVQGRPAGECILVRTVAQVTSGAPLTCPSASTPPTGPGGTGGGGSTPPASGGGGGGGSATTTTTTPVVTAAPVVDPPPAPAPVLAPTRVAAAPSRSAAPTVTLLAPRRGSAVHGRVTLKATTTPTTGIAKVEFLVNGKVVATRTKGPYTLRWDASTLRPGRVVLSVRVTDAQGRVARSASRSLRVIAPASGSKSRS